MTYRYLLLFSLPSVMATMLDPLASMVDNALAGNKNTELFAAVAIGSTIITSFAWVFNFLTHVPTQRISKSYALGDLSKVESNFHTALIFASALGLICSVLLFISKDWLLEVTNTPQELLKTAGEYFSIRLLAVPLFLIFTVLLSFFRGIKKMNFVFILLFIVTSINILLSYLFLYQFNLGAQGIAAGTVLAHLVGILVALIRIRLFEQVRVVPKLKNIESDNIKSLGTDGLNMFGRTLVLTSSFYLLTRVAAGLGTKNLAAYQLGLQGWLFSSFFIDGFAMSGTILTAEFLAKNDWKSLKVLENKLRNLCLFLGASLCLGLLIFESQFFNFFSKDKLVFEILHDSWWIVCIAQIPLSYSYLLDGQIFGLGDYAYLRKHMIIGFSFSILPILIMGSRFTLEVRHLWIALLLLGLYRFLSGLTRWRSFLNARV